ncbi:MAG: hypothetical protein QOF51_2844 [Chloroflexota bacterium]|jgi:DNA-binding CsgD family transcriptional regulator|nr:hypothetical protein [Chloroflexota bacterium]
MSIESTAPRLTAREQQVLDLLAKGMTNQQIATELQIGYRTARFHVASLFRKLGAENRAHAVAVAARFGLLN